MIPHLQVLTQRKQRKQRKAGITQAVLCFLCVPSLFADSVLAEFSRAASSALTVGDGVVVSGGMARRSTRHEPA
jgi:hypothetical protein